MKKQVLEVASVNAFVTERKSKLFRKKTRRQILHEVSFSIEEGEIFGVMGPSGVGKSTLARVILGLHKDFNGTITHHTEKPQMVFQDPYGSLNPRMTIATMLKEALLIADGGKKEHHSAKIAEMLRLVDLDEILLTRRPQKLSGGQRQRVSIALALIGGAKFIVLDEPVSALDATHKRQVLTLLQNLQQNLGLSYLLISHHQKTVEHMCKRVLMLKENGKWTIRER